MCILIFVHMFLFRSEGQKSTTCTSTMSTEEHMEASENNFSPAMHEAIAHDHGYQSTYDQLKEQNQVNIHKLIYRCVLQSCASYEFCIQKIEYCQLMYIVFACNFQINTHELSIERVFTVLLNFRMCAHNAGKIVQF
jgi:hypothetical protein